jgi:cytochrome bd ubiquinol oxidase subunit II
MLSYEMLRVVWWLLLGVLLIGFAIMDGFDLGLGATFRFLGRTEAERRVLIGSFEPVWEGNQVWFILGGGAIFAAWPLLYAASFSSLYPAMFLLLVALILRPVGFGFRNHLSSPRWRRTWDWALTVGGALPGLLFGVAFGNLFLGLPFSFNAMQRPVYSGGFSNLLGPFPLLCGVVSLSMLILHGANYATMKVGEPMAGRARLLGRIASIVFAAAFIGAGFWVESAIGGYRIIGGFDHGGPSNPALKTVEIVTGAWLDNFHHWPWLWAAPAGALLAAVGAHASLHLGRAAAAFIASAVMQAATILTAGFALFPFLMPSSTQPGHSLTIWDASSSAKTLLIMLWAVIVFLPIVLIYTAWVFHVLKGRLSLKTLHEHEQQY